MDEIREISIDDEKYPAILKETKGAPKTLYHRGTFIKEGEMCFAVVGTRMPSAYGHQATLELVSALVDAGLTIISGLAPGIDTLAHQIAVEKKKPTIAVLGTGLDEKSIYPQQNLALSEKILAYGGCLISELPEGTHGSKYTFPKRNRIISGLSTGVLIVEAKEKSGSLITARYAKEQGKKLFAVPGSIFSSNAKGPNSLIKNGAIMVTSGADILVELGMKTSYSAQENISAENKEEQLILSALKEESLYIDKIIEKTHLPASDVATQLALMEISGKIRNLGSGVYAIK